MVYALIYLLVNPMGVKNYPVATFMQLKLKFNALKDKDNRIYLNLHSLQPLHKTTMH